MKTLFVILSIALLSSCDVPMAVAPEIPKTDITGTWVFEGEKIHGEFEIVKYDSIYAVKEGGQYTTDLYTDFIQYKTPVVFGEYPWEIVNVTLLNTKEQENFVLHQGEVNETYTEIRFTSYSFMEYGKESTFLIPVVLRRN